MKIKTAYMWIALIVFGFGFAFARALVPEHAWVSYTLAGLFVLDLLVLFMLARKNMNKRNMAFGLQSITTTVLVIAIVGVLNYLSNKNPFKKDFTQQEMHTLSEQTEKLVKGLSEPLQAVLYGETGDKEKNAPLINNYRDLSPKFQYEFVNTQKELSRAMQASIKKPGTLQLIYKGKDVKVDDLNEEKLTNALIKILKEKNITVCALTGHGEKKFTSKEQDGYEAIRLALVAQMYEVKEINVLQEGKVSETCSTVLIMGANRAFLEKEKTVIDDYLKNGGRAVIAIDPNLKGQEESQDVLKILEPWKVTSPHAMVVDPFATQFRADASTPIAISFNRVHSIVKDFNENSGVIFPITRALEIPGYGSDGLSFFWVVQSTANAWAEFDMGGLAKGQAQFSEGKDKKGPLNFAVAVEGKMNGSKGTQNTRIVVFGTSLFATNAFYRVNSNQDLFMNAVSWTVEDESMISIRKKESEPGKFEIDQKQGQVIGLVTVLVLPLLIAIAGIVIWVLRKKL